MQYQASWKMTACLDGSDSRNDALRRARRTFNEDRCMLIWSYPTDPFLIICRQIDWTIENPSPSDMGSIKMGMRYDNSVEPSFGFDLDNINTRRRMRNRTRREYKVLGRIIQKRYHIPQHVPMLGVEEKRSLADGKLIAALALHLIIQNVAYFWLHPKRPYTPIHSVLLPPDLILLPDFPNRCPRLARRWDVLSRILTTDSKYRRRIALYYGQSIELFIRHKSYNFSVGCRPRVQTESHKQGILVDQSPSPFASL